MSTINISVHHYGSPSKQQKQKKIKNKKKLREIRKEKVKLPLFVNDMLTYTENTKVYTD